MNKGFVIMAQNAEKTSYTDCAEKLSMSIKRVMPDASVSIVTNDRCDWSVFDHTIELPHSDLGGFANDWQVYEASPYDYTIKLEADMYIPRNIDHWWDVLKDRDVVLSSTIRNFKQQISDVRVYRRFIDDNDFWIKMSELNNEEAVKLKHKCYLDKKRMITKLKSLNNPSCKIITHIPRLNKHGNYSEIFYKDKEIVY